MVMKLTDKMLAAVSELQTLSQITDRNEDSSLFEREDIESLRRYPKAMNTPKRKRFECWIRPSQSAL